MTHIIMSYRQGDTDGIARRARDYLTERYPSAKLSFGVNALSEGYARADKETITAKVQSADLLMVLIGEAWLDSAWISYPESAERVAIEAAIQAGLPLLVVLVNTQDIPTPEKLPAPLNQLMQRNPFYLTDANFRGDMASLANFLEADKILPRGLEPVNFGDISEKPKFKKAGAGYELASAGSRFGARFIDNILLQVALTICNIPLQLAAGSGSDQNTFGLLLILLVNIVIAVGYNIVCLVNFEGQTLGKRIVGIRVVSAEEGYNGLTYGMAWRRYFGEILCSLCLSIGYLQILWNEERQGWHDKIAQTLVVRA
ncbi:MAG: RDD family protein [Phototrophicaceae bacterium]